MLYERGLNFFQTEYSVILDLMLKVIFQSRQEVLQKVFLSKMREKSFLRGTLKIECNFRSKSRVLHKKDHEHDLSSYISDPNEGLGSFYKTSTPKDFQAHKIPTYFVGIQRVLKEQVSKKPSKIFRRYDPSENRLYRNHSIPSELEISGSTEGFKASYMIFPNVFLSKIAETFFKGRSNAVFLANHQILMKGLNVIEDIR